MFGFSQKVTYTEENQLKEIPKITSLLLRYSNKVEKDLRDSLAKGDTYALYDMQMYLQSAVIYADRNGDKIILKRLLNLVSIPFEANYIGEDEKWVDTKDKKEVMLYISQYFSLLTRVLSASERNGVDTSEFRKVKEINGHKYNNLKIIQNHIEEFVKNSGKFHANKIDMRLMFKSQDSQVTFISRTKKGIRYLVYTPKYSENRVDGKYIYISLSKDIINNWINLDRNFSKDLKELESDNEFISVSEIALDSSFLLKSINGVSTVRDKEKFSYNQPKIDIKQWKLAHKDKESNNSKSIIKSEQEGVVINFQGGSSTTFLLTLGSFYPRLDMPRNIDDKNMFIVESIMQYSDYCKSLGIEYNPYFKMAYLKGFKKNLLSSFTKDSSGKYYYFNRNYHIEDSDLEFEYSGYGIETPKSKMFKKDGTPALKPKKSIVGVDISHNRRLNWLIESINTFGEDNNISLPIKIIKGYANTLANKVAFKEHGEIHFSIYADGSNRWYRVGYLGRKFYGFNPITHDMDKSFVTGSYALLSVYNSKILKNIDSWMSDNSRIVQSSLAYQLDYMASRNVDIRGKISN